MTDREILEVVLREMTAYGRRWRSNWSGFDGRTLRDQLNGIANWANNAIETREKSDFVKGTDFENYWA